MIHHFLRILYPYNNMRFLPVAAYICSIIVRASAKTSNQTKFGVVVDPHIDGVEINVHVKVVILQSDFNAACSLPATAISNANKTILIPMITNNTCISNGYPGTRITSTPVAGSTTQGFFLNSTQSSEATGLSQSPSLMDLTEFSAASSINKSPMLLSVLGIVIIAIVAG